MRDFGNVRKLPSGRWQARYWSDEAGRQVSGPITFETKTEATRWLAGLQTDQHRGVAFDLHVGRIALGDYADQWLSTRTRLAPRTYEIYARQIRTDIKPMLGRPALADIGREVVRRWYKDLSTNRSPSVAAKAYSRLAQIMRTAVADDRIVKSPCRIAGGAVEHYPEQRSASLEELLRLGEAAEPRYRALVLLAGFGGLRFGELAALRRGDLELDGAESR